MHNLFRRGVLHSRNIPAKSAGGHRRICEERRLGGRKRTDNTESASAYRLLRAFDSYHNALQPTYGIYNPRLPLQNESQNVQRNAGSSDKVFRHTQARRHHELLYKRYRHSPSTCFAVTADACSVQRHRYIGACDNAVVQRLDDAYHSCGRCADDAYIQKDRRRFGKIFH